ncbi:MAG: ATP-independent RNA helicase DbpA [Candidatus Azotimanducaceae bacterium]|jgi:ATP-independent RNA helicase DbpA
MKEFSSLNLNPQLLENLGSLGYHSMTDIQNQSLPSILAGEDVIGQAKTGSGKTAAFALGILNKLKVKEFRVQSLVLCPTRELADQVSKEIRKIARAVHNIKVLTLCGGTPFGPQIGSLEHGAHIVVGTPGRIEEHLRKGTLKLTNVDSLVLDEADRMLDMGFQASLEAILKHVPTNRQTLLFSATFPKQIEALAAKLMNKPITVRVEQHHSDSTIEQSLYDIAEETSRTEAIRHLLLYYQPKSTLIFCNTKVETLELARALNNMGFSCLPLNGDLEQKVRDQTLVRFSNNSVSVLVATDVAARGLDIDSLDAVINFHIARELEVHVHRIGRTGRAGKSGIACTLFSQNEIYKVNKLEDYLKTKIERLKLPDTSSIDPKTFFPEMATIQIDGGRKQKVRAGDILGALTAGGSISGDDVGKISIADNWSYIAVKTAVAREALHKIEEGKIKGRSFRVRRLRG